LFRYRIPGEKYGSMVNPGVGSGTLMPAAPRAVAPSPAPRPELVPAPPSCGLIATGNKLPPIRRNATLPPTDVRLWVAPAGFQLATPAVSVMVERPSEARPPHVLPFP